MERFIGVLRESRVSIRSYCDSNPGSIHDLPVNLSLRNSAAISGSDEGPSKDVRKETKTRPDTVSAQYVNFVLTLHEAHHPSPFSDPQHGPTELPRNEWTFKRHGLVVSGYLLLNPPTTTTDELWNRVYIQCKFLPHRSGAQDPLALTIFVSRAALPIRSGIRSQSY